jgi:hypothetical protein
VNDRFNSFDTIDVGHDWVDVDAAAYSYSVALPLKGARLLSQVDNVADVVVSTANFVDLGVALDHRPKVEVSGIVFEILYINFRGDEVRGIVWEAKVGKGSQIL